MAKNNQRTFNKYFIILILGTVLWLAETAYFGFNDKPENGAEAALDILSFGMIFYGLIGDLLRNVRITKHYHSITTNRINTKNVQFEKGQKVQTKQTVNIINGPKPVKGKTDGK